MLNNSGESGQPCLFPDFRGNGFSFSSLSMFAVGLSYMALIKWSEVPSLPTFWRVFIRAGAGVRVGAVYGLWLLLWFKFYG